MTQNDVEKILNDLERAKNKKYDVRMAVAQAEVNAISQERDAYLDGIYDFAKAINRLLKGENQNEH